MGSARLDPILRTAGFCLVGVLVPAQSVAAEQSWLPVVVKTGKTASPQSEPVVPPSPWAKPAISNSAAPAVSSKVVDFAPDTGVIRPPAPTPATNAPAPDTGVIRPPAPKPATNVPAPDIVGTIESTRTLSEADTARLKEAKAGELPRPEESAGAATIPDTDLARRYCVNVADAAADARIAWQKAKLAETEQEISRRIAALEAKTAEYRQWLDRRDEFSRKATETLVQIYAQMEPDAAALQLVAMEEETAAAVLTKLDPRISSAILNEMQPEKAARLTGTIAGAARVDRRRGAPAPAAAANAGGEPVQQANQGGGRQ